MAISYDYESPREDRGTVVVKELPCNDWGLYQMHGNVMEWCHDWKGEFQPESVIDPRGPEIGFFRVQRGGSWASGVEHCRSAARMGGAPFNRSDFSGFRLARSY